MLQNKTCMILGSIAFAVVIAALCVGFAWQHQDDADVAARVSSLTSQVVALRSSLDGPCPSSGSPVCQRYTYTSAKGVPVLVFDPLRNAAINSPVVVMVLGDWQTTQLVPFTATLTYGSARAGSGTLVLHNDNPSGLPDKADAVSVPVIF